MYESDKNCTSIIVWSLGNESGVGKAQRCMYRWLDYRDPSRSSSSSGGGSSGWSHGGGNGTYTKLRARLILLYYAIEYVLSYISSYFTTTTTTTTTTTNTNTNDRSNNLYMEVNALVTGGRSVIQGCGRCIQYESGKG